MILEFAWACLAAFGFALAFRLGLRDACLAALGGLLSWLAYRLGGHVGLGSFSYLLAATVCGIYSESLAALRGLPATVYSIAALMPLFPGGTMFRALQAALAARGQEALALCVEAFLVAGFLAGGMALASALARLGSRIRGA